MATRKNTAPAGASSASPSPNQPAEWGISSAIELIEVVQRALEPNEQRVSEYGVLAQAVSMLWRAHTQVELLGRTAAAAVPAHSLKAITEGMPAEGAQDGMGALLARLLEIVSHLQCADRILYDLQNVPVELQPAAIVLHRATQDLGRLHADLDEWDATHETPAGEGVRS